MQKMITIGSVGSVVHVRELYSYRRRLPFPFYSSGPLQPERKYSHLDQNASIDADFLRVVHFGGVKICKDNCTVIFAHLLVLLRQSSRSYMLA
jgi:hypothetical protein